MLHGWAGNTVQKDDVVLVWGGSGGLGTQASQIARIAGATPIAVVSDDDRGAYAMRFGAAPRTAATTCRAKRARFASAPAHSSVRRLNRGLRNDERR